MKSEFGIRRLLFPVLALGLLGGATVALAQPEMPPMDVLARLQQALQTAGASALNAAQEASIITLITEFRNALPGPVQNSLDRSPREAYENAILSGDSASAASQAALMANVQAADMAQRETEAAVLAIKVIEILKVDSTAQVDALVAQLGKSGFVRLILSLAGSSGRFGPGGRPGGGPGPGGPPQP